MAFVTVVVRAEQVPAAIDGTSRVFATFMILFSVEPLLPSLKFHPTSREAAGAVADVPIPTLPVAEIAKIFVFNPLNTSNAQSAALAVREDTLSAASTFGYQILEI